MKVLITGGAGFIGCNTAKRLMERGDEVIVLDNLSRKGSTANLEWLQQNGSLTFIQGDVRDYDLLRQVFQAHADVDVVMHFAAQVAVTTSVTNPREDFEINALGTFNVLEAVRALTPGPSPNPSTSLRAGSGRGERGKGQGPAFIFASTNKVYGRMEDVAIVERNGRYEYKDLPDGVSEDRSLDFHSPYGCSKGAADQYVRDYARIYGLRTVSFRQSCCYGPRQFGVEDQGWVAWFTIAAVLGKPITIYGDGKQVRDVLFIDDLVDLYLLAVEKIDQCQGKAYNIGGGSQNQMALLGLIAILEGMLGRRIEYTFDDWRPGDQPVFICDLRRVREDLGWEPRVGPEEGVRRLLDWVTDNRELFET